MITFLIWHGCLLYAYKELTCYILIWSCCKTMLEFCLWHGDLDILVHNSSTNLAIWGEGMWKSRVSKDTGHASVSLLYCGRHATLLLLPAWFHCAQHGIENSSDLTQAGFWMSTIDDHVHLSFIYSTLMLINQQLVQSWTASAYFLGIIWLPFTVHEDTRPNAVQERHVAWTFDLQGELLSTDLAPSWFSVTLHLSDTAQKSNCCDVWL